MSNQQNRLVLLPYRLTAENGAKALLPGMFYETVELTCSACSFDEPQEDCEVCGGEVTYEQKVPVSWDTIKGIWKAAADEFLLAQQPIDSLSAPVAHVRHLINSAIIDSTGCLTRWEDLPNGTPLYTHHEQPTMTRATTDVLAERRRQVAAEGWTPEHDDQHGAHELAEAAACYSLASAGKPFEYFETMWPWEPHWFKPADARRNLVKAAALLLAEIERLDRAASKPEGGSTGSRYPAELVESDGGEA